MTDDPALQQIHALATQVRRDAVRMIAANSSGHVGGALGAAEILAVLYGQVMRYDPKNPDRDRFVLSNGHVCAAYYSVLSRMGFLDPEELGTFRQLNSRLQGHPAHADLPELVETSTGPLGQGFSVANGLAMAAKLDGRSSRVFCLVGDGEMQEGQVWEALMTASQHRLDNMTLIVSYNGLQIDGALDDIKSLWPLRQRLESFGWHVVDVDGHDIQQLLGAFESPGRPGTPSAVIARTVMGKGVPFMEDKAMWHGKAPSFEQAREALSAIGPSPTFTDFPLHGVAL